MKKVLLVIVDACASRVVEPAIQRNQLPNLRRLIETGTWRTDSISIFPSITPACTTSIITGCYPREHTIPGAYWYEPEEHNVVYFGYDIWAILDEGISQFVQDFLINLNEEYIQAPTVYQLASRAGLVTASLNYIIFHGDVAHTVNMPPALALLVDVETPTIINGPNILYFGDVFQSAVDASGRTLSAPGGPLNRFGFSDETTGELLKQLASAHNMPDFTLAYFPHNDSRSHEVGPEEAIDALEDVDRILGEVFEAYGGMDALLDEVCILLTGDHSQSNVIDDAESAGIRLDQLLESFSVADAGTPMEKEDDLVICPNLRAAQIYFHTPTEERIERVVRQLLTDSRVDQALWSDEFVHGSTGGYHVRTNDRGSLRFWPSQDPDAPADVHGCRWEWEGDLRVVDGHVADGVITFDTYPNAFERIVGMLDLPRRGHLWLTAHPGYEFRLEHTDIHQGGGSHGSLHVLDSLSPLIMAGAPEGVELPQQPRLVDVAPLCLTVLGIEPDHAPGASHIPQQLRK
jgi:hypothetical protein